ncbi:MAG: SoxR reducing system RseC family protein [bacterium]
MIETGKIILINKQSCTIEIDANSGCHTCTLKSKCHASSRGKRLITLIIKNHNFQLGDKVELETESKSVIFASFLVFILPLIVSITAYIIFISLSSFRNYGPLIFFAFFLGAEFLVFLIDKAVGHGNFFGPKIIRKL